MEKSVDMGAMKCDDAHIMAAALKPGTEAHTIECMPEAWMTVSEACERLGVTRSRIYALIADKRIRAEKSGSIHKINAADVEAYAATRKWGWPKGKPRSEGDDE